MRPADGSGDGLQFGIVDAVLTDNRVEDRDLQTCQLPLGRHFVPGTAKHEKGGKTPLSPIVALKDMWSLLCFIMENKTTAINVVVGYFLVQSQAKDKATNIKGIVPVTAKGFV